MAEEIDNDSNDNKNSCEEMPVDVAGYGSFSNYISEGYKVIMQGVKTSNSLPSGRNYQFYQTYTNFRDKMRIQFCGVQDIMGDLLLSQGIKNSIHDVMMEDALDTMVSMNDKMLDRATRVMDLMEGVKTGIGELVQEVSGSWNKPKNRDKLQNFTLSIKKNIPRPQFTFKDKIDNSNMMWIPQIKEKSNAIKPLAILIEKTDDGDECFSHPYEYELEMFNVPDNQLKRVQKPTEPLPIEDTPYQFIDQEEQLDKLITQLDQETVIAVDLEHHSYRSFMGFTCLIQLSTRISDYVIDTLSLRHVLYKLNHIFSKPTILKIFHGADCDILWLQRDFNIYVVNMFDTHQAAKLLNFPKLSLAYLLNRYCKVDPNKHFQLFDWRTRPLPDAALLYAREDTHYLLYICQVMTNQLLDKANGRDNILKAAYEQSKQVCKKRFEKLVISEESFMNTYRKGKRFFDNRQLFALKALYLWRDKTARELDESLAYVLPDNMMLNVAENLPREVQGILACCNPVPPLVKANLLEIHYLILRAKEQPLVKVVQEGSNSQMMMNKTIGVSAEQQLLEQWYHPPGEVRDDLPTVLNSNDDDDQDHSSSESDTDDFDPQLSIFSKDDDDLYRLSDNTEIQLDNDILDKLNGLNFVSPYQRYVKVLPYAAQIEKERKEAEIKEAEEYRTRSREQQSLAMEIRTLQESGLIKLKKDEAEDSLKIQLMQERKRKSTGDDQNEIPAKQNRKLNKRERRLLSSQTVSNSSNENVSKSTQPDSSSSEDESQTERPELRGVKDEIDAEPSNSHSRKSLTKNRVNEGVKNEKLEPLPDEISVPEIPGPPSGRRPTNWKEFRQQGGKFKPYDYSQVNYSEKFSSSTNQNQKGKEQKGPITKFDKKKRWLTNPGAKKFTNKRRKRNSVV